MTDDSAVELDKGIRTAGKGKGGLQLNDNSIEQPQDKEVVRKIEVGT